MALDQLIPADEINPLDQLMRYYITVHSYPDSISLSMTGYKGNLESLLKSTIIEGVFYKTKC